MEPAKAVEKETAKVVKTKGGKILSEAYKKITKEQKKEMASVYKTVGTLFVAHRVQASVNAKNKLSVSNRTRADLTEYYIQIGSTRVPQKPVKFDAHGGEIQVKLQKAFHS